MAVTRKGRLKCDECGHKQKAKGDTFLVLNCWHLGPDYVWEDDGADNGLSEHYCTWDCLVNAGFRQVTENVEPLDITGD